MKKLLTLHKDKCLLCKYEAEFQISIARWEGEAGGFELRWKIWCLKISRVSVSFTCRMLSWYRN